MKIVAIADMHGQLPVIPKCDLLLIAGDICPVWNHKTFYQKSWLDTNFRSWLKRVDADQVVAIAGNHDWFFEEDHYGVHGLDLPWKYLRDQAFEYQGLKIWGTPWQPTFLDWAFNLEEPDLVEKWKMIPDDTDILVVHGPPRNYGDDVYKDGMFLKRVGSPGLAERIFQIKPKLAVFGHVHGGYGSWEKDGIQLANVSVLNEAYQLTHEPTVFDLPTD